MSQLPPSTSPASSSQNWQGRSRRQSQPSSTPPASPVRLQHLPEDVLGLIFSDLHSASSPNPAFALAQTSRFFLAAFAGTTLHTVRHAPRAKFAHTAAVLRVAGPRLRAFHLAVTPEERAANGAAAPALLDALALHCPRVVRLTVDGAWGAAAGSLVRRVLHACRCLQRVELVDPPLSVLSVLLTGGVERRSRGEGSCLQNLILRFEDPGSEVLRMLAQRVCGFRVPLVVDWGSCISQSRQGAEVGVEEAVSLCLQKLATEMGRERKARAPASCAANVLSAATITGRRKRQGHGRRRRVDIVDQKLTAEAGCHFDWGKIVHLVG